MTREYEELHVADGVTLARIKDFGGYWLVVIDAALTHRVRLSRHDDAFSVGIDAQWSDAKPGELADYTPHDEYSSNYVNADDIHISDAGLLSVMAKRPSAVGVDIRSGFTAQLPVAFVKPIRMAMAMLIECGAPS
jgi:hypothetical protein